MLTSVPPQCRLLVVFSLGTDFKPGLSVDFYVISLYFPVVQYCLGCPFLLFDIGRLVCRSCILDSDKHQISCQYLLQNTSKENPKFEVQT